MTNADYNIYSYYDSKDFEEIGFVCHDKAFLVEKSILQLDNKHAFLATFKKAGIIVLYNSTIENALYEARAYQNDLIADQLALDSPTIH